MTRPRVLLVDDDASIRRFVAMALDDLDIELMPCASVAEALTVLRRQGAVDLLLTDLMMPGENGLVLLQRLADEPVLRGAARLVVFSAGLQGSVQTELESHDVWRQLSKPVSASELEACVRDAVAASATLHASAPSGAASQVNTQADEGKHNDVVLRAIAEHFGGDRQLFLAFRKGCLTQFEADLDRGNASLARLDLSDLHHLAHSLKSVLTLLGLIGFAATARRLEECAASGDSAEASVLWNQLSKALASLDTAAD